MEFKTMYYVIFAEKVLALEQELFGGVGMGGGKEAQKPLNGCVKDAPSPPTNEAATVTLRYSVDKSLFWPKMAKVIKTRVQEQLEKDQKAIDSCENVRIILIKSSQGRRNDNCELIF